MVRRVSQWLIVLLVLLGPVCAIVLAQGDAGGGGDGTSTSFGSAFFYSRGSVLGTIIIWFLLALSMFSMGLMGYMWLQNRRNQILPPELLARARDDLSNQRYRELMKHVNDDPSFFGQVMSAALQEASQGFGSMIKALEQAGDEFTARRLRRIEVLNVIGNVAPMIGLFGTVDGMILAFQSIVAAGGRPSPVALAAGIGTALVTTFWGLIIAIPSISVYALIRNNVDALTSEALLEAQDLINRFKPASGRAGASSAGAMPGTGRASPVVTATGGQRPVSGPSK